MSAARRISSRPASRGRLAATVTATFVLVTGLLTGCGNGTDGSEPAVAPAPAVGITIDPGTSIDGEHRLPDQSPSPDAAQSPSPQAAASPSPGATPASPGATADCTTLQATWNETNQALVNLSADHPRALANSFHVAAGAMAGVTVPEAIAAPWNTMAEYLTRVDSKLQTVDQDDANVVAAAMAAVVSAADTQAATAAGKKITAFVSGGCEG